MFKNLTLAVSALAMGTAAMAPMAADAQRYGHRYERNYRDGYRDYDRRYDNRRYNYNRRCSGGTTAFTQPMSKACCALYWRQR